MNADNLSDHPDIALALQCTPSVELAAQLDPTDGVVNHLDLREAIYAYLAQQFDAYYRVMGNECMHPDQWFAGVDISQYWAACAWWPRREGMPEAVRCPSMQALCAQYWQGGTFLERLTTRANAAAQWLASQDPNANAAQPNESDDDRRKRLNRERVQRSRQGSKGAAGEAQQQLKLLRAQRDADLKHLKGQVKLHHTAMVEASRELKLRKAQWAAKMAEEEAKAKALLAEANSAAQGAGVQPPAV